MRWINLLLGLLATSAAGAQSTDGVYNLVKRRLPNHANNFRFSLTSDLPDSNGYDKFTVQSVANGTVMIQGTSLSALSSGYFSHELSAKGHTDVTTSLHHYLSDFSHVDIYWFIGSRLDQAPTELPRLASPINGSSTVPWRYHFNTGDYLFLFPFCAGSFY